MATDVKPGEMKVRDLSGLSARLNAATLKFDGARGEGAGSDVSTVHMAAAEWYAAEGAKIALSGHEADALAFGMYWKMHVERKAK